MNYDNKYVNHLFEVIDQMSYKDITVIEKTKNTYIHESGGDKSDVIILVKGIVISSLLGTSGNRLNLCYSKMPGIIMLKKSIHSTGEYLCDIKIDSEKALFYKLDGIKFWNLVSNDEILREYVLEYMFSRINREREVLVKSIDNTKYERLYAFLYECTKLFGVKNSNDGSILIDHNITHKTIGDFCGIRNRSSVTRIMGELIKENIIKQDYRKIIVMDLEYLKIRSDILNESAGV